MLFRSEVYIVEALMYGGWLNSPRSFMPIAKVLGVSGSTIYLDDSAWGATALTNKSNQFDEPSFSTVGVEGYVYIFDQDGTVTTNYQISSVDTSANTITVSGGPITGTFRDKHKWVVFSAHDDQSSTAWPRTYGLVNVDPDGTFGSSSTSGWRLK